MTLTRYPEVNALMRRLLADQRRVLGDLLVGLYLHGSLTGEDFNPARSDIDFVAATRAPLPTELLPALEEMHAAITHSGLAWAEKLEGSYVPLNALRRYDPDNSAHPALRVDGSFAIDGHGPDWVIQLYVLRERGVAVYGPPPASLIDPIGPDDLRRAARGVLEDWWAPMLEDPSRLRSREYQAYAALTMCRCLYTFATGDVGAKSAAAAWARQHLSADQAALVQQALHWPHGPQPDRLPETLDLIRATLEKSR
jgi:hypothetical protein